MIIMIRWVIIAIVIIIVIIIVIKISIIIVIIVIRSSTRGIVIFTTFHGLNIFRYLQFSPEDGQIHHYHQKMVRLVVLKSANLIWLRLP